ncbi:hypothetical protein BVRB_3g061120 [Beta vulgaris subsp. vulgaris]|nr:hypothetical protein BVRB_3g061120 [Beta vulgaris subsp. vulgaris]
MASKISATVMLFVVAVFATVVNGMDMGMAPAMMEMPPAMAPTPASTPGAGFSLGVSPVVVAFSLLVSFFLRH